MIGSGTDRELILAKLRELSRRLKSIQEKLAASERKRPPRGAPGGAAWSREHRRLESLFRTYDSRWLDYFLDAKRRGISVPVENPFGFSLRSRRESVSLSDIRKMQESEADTLACKHRDYTRAQRVLKQRPAAYARAHGLRLGTTTQSRASVSARETRLERAEREVEEAKRSGSREEYQAALKRYTEAQYEVDKMKGRKKNPLDVSVSYDRIAGAWFVDEHKGSRKKHIAGPFKRYTDAERVWEEMQRKKNPQRGYTLAGARAHAKRFSAASGETLFVIRSTRGGKTVYGIGGHGGDVAREQFRREGGDVEIVETYVGGRKQNPSRRDYWIQGSIKRPGALHRKLGVPEGRDIPMRLLERAIAHPEEFERTHAAQMRLKKEAVEARTLKRLPRHHGLRKRNPSREDWFPVLYIERRMRDLYITPKIERERDGVKIPAISLHEAAYVYESQARDDLKRLVDREARIAEKKFDLHVHPIREVKKNSSKQNPSADLASAEDLYDRFHGEPPHRIGTFEVPTSIPPDLTELGDLLKIKIIGSGRMLQQIAFEPGEGVKLAADPKSQSLYIIGDRQRLPQNCLVNLEQEFGEAAKKNQFVLGTIKELTYRTQKGFDKFETIDYYHKLGEETGERPLLVYDRRNHRLLIVGGAYKVKPEGITN